VLTWPRITAALALALLVCGAAHARGTAEVAALQVGLRREGLYAGSVDGVYGTGTSTAVAELQRRAGVPATGVLGAGTRQLLGAYARATLGSRPLAQGMSGWDVAALQFLLAWHGFPSGTLNGVLGVSTEAALERFEQWAGLPEDGVAGPDVLGALRGQLPQSPIPLAWPLELPMGDPFGPRGDRFHAGVDIPAPMATPVSAAGDGEVVYAGWRDGGWGNEVTIAHGHGVRAIYAHLSAVGVAVGDHVDAGETVGLVGATGDATGPHLHFELRLRGAAIDPLTALPPPIGVVAGGGAHDTTS
jgi:peptidoglycan hydrolase-like protein with peptidoglycan-binding domain